MSVLENVLHYITVCYKCCYVLTKHFVSRHHKVLAKCLLKRFALPVLAKRDALCQCCLNEMHCNNIT